MASLKIDHHACLNPIGDAAKASSYKVTFLPLNMHPIVDFFGISIAKDSFLKKLEYIFAHLIFARLLFKNRQQDLIIVREFLTIPLALSWPLYFFFKKKLLFIVNHNLQKANASKLEGLVLKALLKFGMHPLFLDTEAGLKELKVELPNNQYLVLPLPIIKTHQRSMQDNKFTIGIIGDNRKEKKIADIAEIVDGICIINGMRLLIGSTDKSLLDTWHNKGAKTINTTDAENYVQAFCLSDVIVLNYDLASYYYRISGVICDAIAANTVIVCPDFPILKDQVTRLGCVGITFSELGHIAPILLYIKENYESFKVGFLSQQKSRSMQNITALIDSYIESTAR
ncbi:MAG: hypothetical protein PHG00_04370 [Methylococcales bacterium]|nr:hypothetical protein [Methylococcales bacterium]